METSLYVVVRIDYNDEVISASELVENLDYDMGHKDIINTEIVDVNTEGHW